jgi:hypothetical protein
VLEAVEGAFGADVDFTTLQKIYGASEETEKRYKPEKCIRCESKVVMGIPAPKHISTSYLERQNLTMRMNIRRFTRLTNAFPKKLDNQLMRLPCISCTRTSFASIRATEWPQRWKLDWQCCLGPLKNWLAWCLSRSPPSAGRPRGRGQHDECNACLEVFSTAYFGSRVWRVNRNVGDAVFLS